MHLALDNNEHHLLIDMMEFGWPLAYVFFRIMLDAHRNLAEPMQAAAIVVIPLAVFDLLLLSFLDGGVFLNVTKDAPILGIFAMAAIGCMITSVALQWHANSMDNQDALQGVLGQPLIARGDGGRALAKRLSSIAIVSACCFVSGLVYMAYWG
jgi:hypothetical protein